MNTFNSISKKLLLTSFLLCLALLGKAQVFNIKGSLKSAKDEVVPFTTVALMNVKDSSLVKANVANQEGKFQMNGINIGTYFLVVKNIAFTTYRSKNIEIKDKNINLEPFVLTESTTEIGEVEVTGQKQLVEVQADKTVFNVENTINAVGTDGFELLRKAPGVVIDNNDNIMVEGKDGVQFFIDGKQTALAGTDLVNFLKTLQSSDIESFEIITQPSSKYDAAGTAGIINIKLKREKGLGTNGSIGTGYAYGRFSKFNNSVSLNNRSKKVNIYANYSNWIGQRYNFFNFNRTQFGTNFNSKAENISEGQNHNGKIGVDFYASPKSTFGLIVNGNFRDAKDNNESFTRISSATTEEVSEVLRARSEDKTDSYNVSANLNYRYADTTGRSLNIDLDYGQFNNQRDNFQPNSYYNPTETQLLSEVINYMDTPIEVNIMSAKLDYEQRLGKGVLALGAKFSLVSTDNTFDFYDVIDDNNILNTARSNNFIYDENVNAVYVNYSQKWKKFSMQMGLRVEQTVSNGELNSLQDNQDRQVQRNYTDFFPSGGITYNINRKNSLAFIYSRRITRPNYQSLNPFEVKIDELSFRKGNAFLQPQYTDNFKLSHTYKYALTTSVSYSLITDFFAQVTQVQGTEGEDARRSFIQEQNVANQEVWNVSMTYPFSIAKWWSVYLSANLAYNSFAGKNDDFKPLSQTTFNFYAQNSFSLPKGFRFELSGWYNSPSIWGGTFRTKSIGSLDVALQKNFMQGKLSTRLALSDMFFTSPWYGSMEFGDLSLRGNGGWESRQIRVNLTYNFGHKDVKKSRRRKTGIEDENNRIGGNN